MALLDDIFANKELGDDLKFQIGTHEVSLGDLRGLHSRVSERDSQIQSLAGERDKFRGQYDELAGTMTRLLGQADKAATASLNEPPPKTGPDLLREALGPLLQSSDPAEPLFQDKVFGAFANRLKTDLKADYETQLKELRETQNALRDVINNGFQATTAAIASERERNWYSTNRNEIPKDKDGKRLPLDVIKQFAASRGIYQLNQQGQFTNLLDLDRALETLTEPTRRQADLDKATQEAYERGIREGRTAAGKVIPFMSERSAGGSPKEQYSTSGKSPRQIIRERLAQGLTEISEDVAGNQ